MNILVFENAAYNLLRPTTLSLATGRGSTTCSPSFCASAKCRVLKPKDAQLLDILLPIRLAVQRLAKKIDDTAMPVDPRITLRRAHCLQGD